MFVLVQTRSRFVLLKPQMCSLGFGLALFQRKMLIHHQHQNDDAALETSYVDAAACGRIQNWDTSDNKSAPLSSLF